uniref:Formyl_trans_N domain-containing protein n=1 Tax=Macrostomum lignano TaxID=282301 RepID=A0A1I8FD84_9PLAT
MVITASSRAALRVLLLGSDQFTSIHLLRLFEMFQVAQPAVHACNQLVFQFDQFDIGVVASFGRFIPASVLHQWPLAPSMWRGSAPILYTILAGDAFTGVSITEVSASGFDKGGVLLQRRLELAGDETAPMLVDRLAGLGCDCLEATLDDLPAARRPRCRRRICPMRDRWLKGRTPLRPPGLVLYERGQVEPDSPGSRTRLAAALSHRIRRNSSRTSRSPVTLAGHRRVNLGQASELPGQIRVDLDSGLMLIGCSDGGWAGFTSLTRAGKPKLTASEMRNGYLG